MKQSSWLFLQNNYTSLRFSVNLNFRFVTSLCFGVNLNFRFAQIFVLVIIMLEVPLGPKNVVVIT